MSRPSERGEPSSPRELGFLALSHPAVIAVTQTGARSDAREGEGSPRLSRLRCWLRALLRRSPAAPSSAPELYQRRQ